MNKTQSVYNYRLEKDVLEAVQVWTESNLADMTGYELLSESVHICNYKIDEFGMPEKVTFALFNTKQEPELRKSVALEYDSEYDGLKFVKDGKQVTARNMQSSGMFKIMQELYALKLFVWKFQEVFGVIPELENIEVSSFHERRNGTFDRVRIRTTFGTSRSWSIENDELYIRETETGQWKKVTL